MGVWKIEVVEVQVEVVVVGAVAAVFHSLANLGATENRNNGKFLV